MLTYLQRSTINFLASLAIFPAIIYLQVNTLTQQTQPQTKDIYIQQEKEQKLQANLQKKLPSFGYDNLLADWTFLQFVQYFGDSEAREVTGHSVITDYFEAIVKRDPRFLDAYFAISPANSLFAAQPEKTIELLEQVLNKINPEDPGYPFYVWTYKATDEILFIGDLKAAEKSYDMAANWAALRQDQLGDDLAKRFKQTADFLGTNPDSTKAQIGAWMYALSTAKDQKTAAYIINQLESLGARISMSDDGKLIVKPPQDV